MLAPSRTSVFWKSPAWIRALNETSQCPESRRVDVWSLISSFQQGEWPRRGHIQAFWIFAKSRWQLYPGWVSADRRGGTLRLLSGQTACRRFRTPGGRRRQGPTLRVLLSNLLTVRGKQKYWSNHCAVLLTTPFLDKFLWRHYFDSVSVILSNVSCVHHSDGIHSLEALKKFNFEKIIVCKVEYFILYSDGR